MHLHPQGLLCVRRGVGVVTCISCMAVVPWVCPGLRGASSCSAEPLRGRSVPHGAHKGEGEESGGIGPQPLGVTWPRASQPGPRGPHLGPCSSPGALIPRPLCARQTLCRVPCSWVLVSAALGGVLRASLGGRALWRGVDTLPLGLFYRGRQVLPSEE